MVAAVSALVVSCCLTVFATVASSWNYPGGYALKALHQYHDEHMQAISKEPIKVHIDTASAMTGVSRFGEKDSAMWSYSKKEDLNDFSNFTYLLAERPEVTNFTVVRRVHGFDGVSTWPLSIKISPKIYVLARANDPRK